MNKPLKIKLVLLTALASFFILWIFTERNQILKRAEYQDLLQGFWMRQCIVNWTGLIPNCIKLESQ